LLFHNKQEERMPTRIETIQRQENAVRMYEKMSLRELNALICRFKQQFPTIKATKTALVICLADEIEQQKSA
jgi:hypothetical protein